MASKHDLPQHGRMASINDIEMYYEMHGQGEPLVLLHGFFGSHAFWAPYLAHLVERFRVITVDLRGHGRSTNPRDEFSHVQAARDVFALLDLLGIDHCKAMGFSTGAMVLLQMATQRPQRIEAMVLISGASYWTEQTRTLNRQSPPSPPPERWQELVETHKHGEEQILKLSRQFHGFADVYDDMNFTAPYLSTIKARTLIVHGDRDVFFPVSIPVEMYSSIPHAYLWVVPNWGHSAPHLGSEAMKALFIESTLSFLAGTWEGG